MYVQPIVCTGKVKRVWFFFKRVVCSESREHFHVSCKSCDFACLMETYDARKKRVQETK